MPDALLRVSRDARAPSALLDAVRRTQALPPPDPQSGQLWRLAWNGTTALVLVLDDRPAGVLAAPVGVDAEVAGARTFIIGRTRTSLGVDVVVWPALAREVPTFVLDVCLGAVEPAIARATTAVHRGTAATTSPPGITMGPESTSPFEPAARTEAELSDVLEKLAAAVWAPEATSGGAAAPGDLLPDEALRDLPALLGLNLPVVWEILRGKRPLTTEQAELLASRYGVSASGLLAGSSLPLELVTELNHPRWRPRLQERQALTGMADDELRRVAAYGAFAMAARQTGTSSPAWRDRLQRYFDTREAQ